MQGAELPAKGKLGFEGHHVFGVFGIQLQMIGSTGQR
jgi:hypothetical protein